MIRSIALALSLAVAAPVVAQDSTPEIFGEPAACAPGAGGTAVIVRVDGFRDRTGNVRIAIYRATDEEFLASGKYVTRIDEPLTKEGSMTVCAPVPEPGPYAVVALHDRNADGRLSVWSDGFGFSRNPRLGTSKPDVELTKVSLAGIVPMSITLNYVQGFSARPWKGR